MRYTHVSGYVQYSAAARSSFGGRSCSQHPIKRREEDGAHVLELRPLVTGALMSHQTFCVTLLVITVLLQVKLFASPRFASRDEGADLQNFSFFLSLFNSKQSSPLIKFRLRVKGKNKLFSPLKVCFIIFFFSSHRIRRANSCWL